MLCRNRVKGQGLPLNVIILAVIGIIILVIVIAMVNFYAVKFGKSARNMTEANCPGEPKLVGECDEPIFGQFKDVTPGYVCCKKKVIKQKEPVGPAYNEPVFSFAGCI